MKVQFAKLLVLLVVCAGISVHTEAQRRGRTTRNQTSNQSAIDTTKQPTQVNNNNQQPTNYSPYGNIPIKMAPQTGGFNDTVKKSLRTDGVFEKGLNERTPLDYENLRKDDALFSERVWREIDIREKMNQPFRYNAQDDNGDQRFISILVKAVRSGKVTAFNADDDRFTTPLDSADFVKALNGGDNRCDTNAVYNLLDPTKIDSFVVVCPTINPDEIVKFRIKEDWVFDREASRLFCRIIGIAPLKTVLGADKKTEIGSRPLFWVYYPDIRPTLAKYEVYNPKNMGQSRMTWEELFESRMFSSYVVKSTIDNPLNKNIRNVIKD
ncbi:MAG: gliding motility protein GldN, partial [Bacteroidetes bacterium]|nr:gliding motility protein GldN [Bacteroidota bacterium]